MLTYELHGQSVVLRVVRTWWESMLSSSSLNAHEQPLRLQLGFSWLARGRRRPPHRRRLRGDGLGAARPDGGEQHVEVAVVLEAGRLAGVTGGVVQAGGALERDAVRHGGLELPGDLAHADWAVRRSPRHRVLNGESGRWVAEALPVAAVGRRRPVPAARPLGAARRPAKTCLIQTDSLHPIGI